MDELDSLTQLQAATKEATTETTMTGGNEQNHPVDSDPIAKGSVAPTKTQRISKQITIVQNQTPIDVTDGQWHSMNNLYYAQSGSGHASIKFPGDIPINYMLGIMAQQDISNTSTTNQIMRGSDRELQAYAFFKLHSMFQKFKNFNIFVERDESGGLQIQDPLVFQIRKRYYGVWSNNAAVQTSETTEFSLTDLNHGIGSEFTFNTEGWISGGDFANATAQRYRTLTELLGVYNNSNWKVWPETPAYEWEIRLANFGVFTNVIVWMSYISEWNFNWSAQVRFLASNALLPEPIPTTYKSIFDWNEDDKPTDLNKKRKLF